MTCVEMTQAQAPLAQLAEHLTLNQGVQGSNPWRRTSDYRIRSVVFFLLSNILKKWYSKNNRIVGQINTEIYELGGF